MLQLPQSHGWLLVGCLTPHLSYQTWQYLWVTRWVSYKKQVLLTLRHHLSPPRYFGGVCVARLFSFCVVLLCIFTFWVARCEVCNDFCIQKRCSVRLYLQFFVGRFMSYLRYLCYLAYSGVQHVLCTLCFQFFWVVHFRLPLRYSLPFIYYLR